MIEIFTCVTSSFTPLLFSEEMLPLSFTDEEPDVECRIRKSMYPGQQRPDVTRRHQNRSWPDAALGVLEEGAPQELLPWWAGAGSPHPEEAAAFSWATQPLPFAGGPLDHPPSSPPPPLGTLVLLPQPPPPPPPPAEFQPELDEGGMGPLPPQPPRDWVSVAAI